MILPRLLLFTTIFASALLPGPAPAAEETPPYQPKPGEFPPHHSDRRIGGEIVSEDFIHRKGQFRASKDGALMDFTLAPYGYVSYLNAEVDLRDVPLGLQYLFFLHQDAEGNLTNLATMQEPFTSDAAHSFTYKVDEVKAAEGKIETTKHSEKKNQPDLGKRELIVKPATRIWKGDQQVKLAEVAVGDELLFNLTGKSGDAPGWCSDIWVGVETQAAATAEQRKKFVEFVKRRGIAGNVDKTEGNLITISLFSGDFPTFKELAGDLLAVGKDIGVCVVNDELRSWNPPVDKEKGSIVSVEKTPMDGYGTAGTRVTVKVAYMLEGFRRNHQVRVYLAGWTPRDAPYGESLMGYGYARLLDSELVENPPKEYPRQFPFRTDFGNRDMSWFHLDGDQPPPKFSEHLMFGELVKVDPATHSGQFRADRTGELVDFSMIAKSSIRYLNAEGRLDDLPLGMRYRFNMYQDENGKFARCSMVGDEFSYLASNVLTLRVDEIRLDENKLFVAKQMPPMKNYNGDYERADDIGREILLVSPETRVWKDKQPAKLSDLKVDDSLLVNMTGEQTGAPSRCTDLWIYPSPTEGKTLVKSLK